jgi:hypothetical protein
MFCPKCGNQNKNESRFCQECGTSLALNSQSSAQETKPSSGTAAGTRDEFQSDKLVHPRNPPLSSHLALLALIQPGLAHIIYGQVMKGLSMLVLFWLTVASVFMPVIILAVSIIDGYMVGNALKAGQSIKKWAFFPRV